MLEDEGFSARERKILKVLFRKVRPLSTKEISRKTGLAWETCRDILSNLTNDDYVISQEKETPEGRTFYTWKFNYNKKKELKERLKHKK